MDWPLRFRTGLMGNVSGTGTRQIHDEDRGSEDLVSFETFRSYKVYNFSSFPTIAQPAGCVPLSIDVYIEYRLVAKQ